MVKTWKHTPVLEVAGRDKTSPTEVASVARFLTESIF